MKKYFFIISLLASCLSNAYGAYHENKYALYLGEHEERWGVPQEGFKHERVFEKIGESKSLKNEEEQNAIQKLLNLVYCEIKKLDGLIIKAYTAQDLRENSCAECGRALNDYVKKIIILRNRRSQKNTNQLTGMTCLNNTINRLLGRIAKASDTLVKLRYYQMLSEWLKLEYGSMLKAAQEEWQYLTGEDKLAEEMVVVKEDLKGFLSDEPRERPLIIIESSSEELADAFIATQALGVDPFKLDYSTFILHETKLESSEQSIENKIVESSLSEEQLELNKQLDELPKQHSQHENFNVNTELTYHTGKTLVQIDLTESSLGNMPVAPPASDISQTTVQEVLSASTTITEVSSSSRVSFSRASRSRTQTKS
jgi:hypothetical protein